MFEIIDYYIMKLNSNTLKIYALTKSKSVYFIIN